VTVFSVPMIRSNYWLSAILIDPAKTEELLEIVRLKLDKSNIESRPLWKPMHLQPVFLNILIMVLLPRHFLMDFVYHLAQILQKRIDIE
jgi:hypothetical protein